MKCIFCNIIKDKEKAFKIWEDKNFLLILTIGPIKPGHVMLLPKKHYSDAFDMPNKLYLEMFAAVKKIVPKIKKATGSKRVGLAIEGFGVAHVHIHLVPINKGNELNPELAKIATNASLLKMQKKYSKFFK